MPGEVSDYTGQIGLCTAIVCTALSTEEMTARLNTDHPTGISSRWEIADHFPDGTPNGKPCDEQPGTRRHLLFEC
ncbi:hypothetical protein ACWEQG_01545 [Microbispora sp. NPDC004025]